MNLENKNILFISPKFFNYENEIIKYLTNKNANVFFFDERPSKNQFVKALIRLNLFTTNLLSYIYYNNIFNYIINQEDKFDYVLLIKGEATPVWFINKFKNYFKKSILIYYTYDSISNLKKSSSFYNLFNYKFTFENDSYLSKHNFKHRPLFFLPDYESKNNYTVNQDIDILFLATLHSDRYIVFEKFKKNISKFNLNIYNYMYIPGGLNFLYNKICNTAFKNVSRKDISKKSLQKSEIINLFRRSKIILDIHHPLQNGLTMRTIETLGSKRKLITTNENIVNYDFYNDTNICVIDRNNPLLPINFLQKPYMEIDEEIYIKYSLSKWVEEIFACI